MHIRYFLLFNLFFMHECCFLSFNIKRHYCFWDEVLITALHLNLIILDVYQFFQHNFFCTLMNAAHSLNPFPLMILFHFLSYRLSFLHAIAPFALCQWISYIICFLEHISVVTNSSLYKYEKTALKYLIIFQGY